MFADWVKKIVADYVGCEIPSIGMEAILKDGRKVKIVDGQYWGDRGVSNFWYWQEILPNGSLSEKKEHGYGYNFIELIKELQRKV